MRREVLPPIPLLPRKSQSSAMVSSTTQMRSINLREFIFSRGGKFIMVRAPHEFGFNPPLFCPPPPSLFPPPPHPPPLTIFYVIMSCMNTTIPDDQDTQMKRTLLIMLGLPTQALLLRPWLCQFIEWNDISKLRMTWILFSSWLTALVNPDYQPYTSLFYNTPKFAHIYWLLYEICSIAVTCLPLPADVVAADCHYQSWRSSGLHLLFRACSLADGEATETVTVLPNTR